MAQVSKKTWPDLFEKVKAGQKNFDVRLNDFDIKEGDTLVLEEYDPKTKSYTGRKLKKKVKFILKTTDQKFWTKKDIAKYGLQVIGF